MTFSNLQKLSKQNQSDEKAKNKELQKKLDCVLGSKGPMLFGPPRHPMVFTSQFYGMCQSQVTAYALTKANWESIGSSKKYFTDSEILRIVQFCQYNEDKALYMLRKTDPRYLRMSAKDLQEQLNTKTLFPVPQLQTKTGEDVFYMRPSRFFPKETTTRSVICNLTYVMDSIYQRTYSYDNGVGGIAFVANMNGWTMENFSTDYCLKFMQGLQGQLGPVNVNLFLIVNPPSWFNQVWKIMKPMLSAKFRKKVHMIPEKDLGKFLAPGYEKCLPDEFVEGESDTDQMLRDFITYRLALEDLVGTAHDQELVTFGCLNRVAAGKGKGNAMETTDHSSTDATDHYMWTMDESSKRMNDGAKHSRRGVTQVQ